MRSAYYYPSNNVYSSYQTSSFDFLYDPMGNLVQRTDSTEKGVDEITGYNAYGFPLESIPVGSAYGQVQGPPISFQPTSVGYEGQYGYYSDAENGLVLLGARYYDPGTTRFLNRDPIDYKGGSNLYAFCGGNPINRVDPLGTQAEGDVDPFDTKDDDKDAWERDSGAYGTREFTEKELELDRELEKDEFFGRFNRPIIRTFPEWEPGDPIDSPTPEGEYPKWYSYSILGKMYTVQGRYWMQRAASAKPGEFSEANLRIMQQGFAEQARVLVRVNATGLEKEMDVSKELHHINGNRGTPGFDQPWNLEEVWPWEHDAVDKDRHVNYTFIKFVRH